MKPGILVILLSLSMTGQAQEWAPIGATWHYNYYGSSYSVFESTNDSLINGITCRKIQKSKTYSRPAVEYTYYSNDSVFFYDFEFNEFQLLYDFDASPGEYWFYRFPGYSFPGDIDTIKTIVDSTDFVTINSVSLKRLYIHYEPVGFEEDWMFDDYPFTKNSQIIAFIGDTKNMISNYVMDELIFDSSYPSGLRCYDDNVIGHYETGIVDSCNYVNVLALDENENQDFAFYPNPATDYLFFDQPVEQYEIYTSDGRLVFSDGMENSNSICVQQLSAGVYLLVTRIGERTRAARFIKE